MLYEVAQSFVKLDETQGILQNASSGNSIEVSNEASSNSGIILKPGESLSFSDTDIYVRTIGNKNSAVRVVPFVEGFSEGSGQDMSDFDVRQFDSVGILIYSKDAAGNLHEKPIHYVNPKSTDKQLVEFGKIVVATTTNAYQATYRVTKNLCDKPFDHALIVDSPFTEDFTDNCGVTWITNGTVTISNGAANFNRSYLRSNVQVTFGGADFTISFYANINSNSENWGGLFCAQSLTSNTRKGQLMFQRYNFESRCIFLAYDSSENPIVNIFAPDFLGARHHVEFDYSHDDSTLKIFVDGILSATREMTIERLARYIFLGTNGYSQSNQRMTGSLSNLKIYDGVALHTENFTPE